MAEQDQGVSVDGDGGQPGGEGPVTPPSGGEETQATAGGGERTFTQAELDQIVKDRLDRERGSRGLMLAAVTFYYRSSEEIAQLCNGQGSQSDPLGRHAAFAPHVAGGAVPPTPPRSEGAEEYQLEP